ncbi:hypothetical protein PILCRDRAFT_820186 [Piloderma croceum F 1598]|uniref:Uncharacterized protein n=1 Tax=Piloderma croceum (strain F 1598) TaxID=765440 RepID=A0A0C3FWP7_PILCF|nr:hypothetical protein PILCRDRAFT_820186 [Piloderma croceum F 1598]
MYKPTTLLPTLQSIFSASLPTNSSQEMISASTFSPAHSSQTQGRKTSHSTRPHPPLRILQAIYARPRKGVR